MLEQFCKSILHLEIEKSKALANLVMGLSSHPQARSVAELSLSKCYHYQYSSINKVIDGLFKAEKGIEESDRQSRRWELEKNFGVEEGLCVWHKRRLLVTQYRY